MIQLINHKLSVWITRKFAPGFHEHLISRTRFIDDLVEKSTAEVAEQYVILGAGYDLRAHRLNLPAKLKIFEVDQTEVQRIKRSILPENSSKSIKVTYVGIDFNHQSLTDRLLESGFDQNRSTVFTLEGVSQYITKDAVISTIREIAALSRNSRVTLYISYVDKLLSENPKACFGKGYSNPVKKAETIQNLAAKVGESWISFYDAEEVEETLTKHGFSVIENKTLADLITLYFAPVGRTIPEDELFNLEHSVLAKTKG